MLIFMLGTKPFSSLFPSLWAPHMKTMTSVGIFLSIQVGARAQNQSPKVDKDNYIDMLHRRLC